MVRFSSNKLNYISLSHQDPHIALAEGKATYTAHRELLVDTPRLVVPLKQEKDLRRSHYGPLMFSVFNEHQVPFF